MPQKKLQVFVSSTYTDMKAERQAAVEVILQAGHIPAGMELFASGDESQLETIRRWIDGSDVFMLILGARYGSLEPKSGKSYVQLEYEYAIEKKKPFFAAVISEKCIEAKTKLYGPEVLERINGLLLESFRKAVTSRTCRFFDDPKDIKISVFESLGIFMQYENLVGWVRGNDVIDAKGALEQLSRLQTENASLTQQIEELKSKVTNLAGAEPSVADFLSEEAKTLLMLAANADGHIIYSRHLSGASVGAGNKSAFSGNNPREEARWKAAIDELVLAGMAEDPGNRGQVFRLTKRGYDAADEITKKSVVVSANIAPINSQ